MSLGEGRQEQTEMQAWPHAVCCGPWHPGPLPPRLPSATELSRAGSQSAGGGGELGGKCLEPQPPPVFLYSRAPSRDQSSYPNHGFLLIQRLLLGHSEPSTRGGCPREGTGPLHTRWGLCDLTKRAVVWISPGEEQKARSGTLITCASNGVMSRREIWNTWLKSLLIF